MGCCGWKLKVLKTKHGGFFFSNKDFEWSILKGCGKLSFVVFKWNFFFFLIRYALFWPKDIGDLLIEMFWLFHGQNQMGWLQHLYNFLSPSFRKVLFLAVGFFLFMAESMRSRQDRIVCMTDLCNPSSKRCSSFLILNGAEPLYQDFPMALGI